MLLRISIVGEICREDDCNPDFVQLVTQNLFKFIVEKIFKSKPVKTGSCIN